MSALKIMHRNLAELFQLTRQLTSYALLCVYAFVSPRAKTAAMVVALSSQLASCIDRVQHEKERKPRFTPAFRLLWVVLSRFLEGWEDLAQLMKPATVKRWHRAGFRLYRRWLTFLPVLTPHDSPLSQKALRSNTSNPCSPACIEPNTSPATLRRTSRRRSRRSTPVPVSPSVSVDAYWMPPAGGTSSCRHSGTGRYWGRSSTQG